jgi:hypothetical protein
VRDGGTLRAGSRLAPAAQQKTGTPKSFVFKTLEGGPLERGFRTAWRRTRGVTDTLEHMVRQLLA